MSIRMSKSLMIAALLTAGVATSGSVLAQAADGERSAPRAEKIAAMKERHAERMTERLDGLSERLALRADQRPAWDDFRKTVTDGRPAHDKRAGKKESVTTLERMTHMEKAAEARLEQVRKTRAAAEKLYAVLDEDQRKVFDERPAHPREGKKHPAPRG